MFGLGDRSESFAWPAETVVETVLLGGNRGFCICDETKVEASAEGPKSVGTFLGLDALSSPGSETSAEDFEDSSGVSLVLCELEISNIDVWATCSGKDGLVDSAGADTLLGTTPLGANRCDGLIGATPPDDGWGEGTVDGKTGVPFNNGEGPGWD